MPLSIILINCYCYCGKEQPWLSGYGGGTWAEVRAATGSPPKLFSCTRKVAFYNQSLRNEGVREVKRPNYQGMVWYGMVLFNVPLDTVQVISETGGP